MAIIMLFIVTLAIILLYIDRVFFLECAIKSRRLLRTPILHGLIPDHNRDLEASQEKRFTTRIPRSIVIDCSTPRQIIAQCSYSLDCISRLDLSYLPKLMR